MKSVAFIGTLGVSDEVRLAMPATELSKRGYDIAYLTVQDLSGLDFKQFSIVVFNRPMPATRKIIQICRRLGIKIIIDQDDDFRTIPRHHVAYRNIGPGNPGYIADWIDQLGSADLVTVSTPTIGAALASEVKRYKIIPNGWSKDNILWTQPMRPNPRITIGWTGTITHRQDFVLAEDAIKKVLKHNKNVRLLIGLDLEIYKIFKDVPEDQKIFYPGVPYSTYPYVIRQMDILMAPLRDDDFNRGKSDIKTMEAGTICVPWIASPVEPYNQWEVGGLFAQNFKWEEPLNRLIESKDLRDDLANQGNTKSVHTREASILAQDWVDIIENL